MTSTQDTWPAGATWVFQGSVAEDASAGTHVCTLTVTPGVGNELEVLYGFIKGGNTATAQIASVTVTDGTNIVGYPLNGQSVTSANPIFPFPQTGAITANTSATGAVSMGFMISGAMQLILTVSTAAVSVTQTYAVVCRIKGSVPTATLADTVGTPTLTINTNKVF